MKTLPELASHLRLDLLLAADGPLIDSILLTGTNLIFGRNSPPPATAAAVQKVKWSRDYDRPRPQQAAMLHQAKTIRMSMMGRPVREKSSKSLCVRVFHSLRVFMFSSANYHLPYITITTMVTVFVCFIVFTTFCHSALFVFTIICITRHDNIITQNFVYNIQHVSYLIIIIMPNLTTFLLFFPDYRKTELPATIWPCLPEPRTSGCSRLWTSLTDVLTCRTGLPIRVTACPVAATDPCSRPGSSPIRCCTFSIRICVENCLSCEYQNQIKISI